jgi:DnaJ-class molecular chaperone
MKTYWTYEVFSVEGVKRRSLVIAPCDDLAAALAGAFKDVTYYIGVCGYKVALHFHELCATCQGTGLKRRRTKRAMHTTKCLVCKGNPIIREITETRWIPNEGVALVDRSTPESEEWGSE